MSTGTQPPRPSARPARSRLRTFLPLGVAAWLVLEIWLLTLVAGATSGLVVFLLLVAGVVLGSVVIKRAGRRAFRNLTEALREQQAGAPPESRREEGNGLTMLAGLLLILPGLVSDALGLLLLLPPVQRAVRRGTERQVDRRLREARPGTLGDAYRHARMHRPDGKVVQGEVVREDPADNPRDPRPPLTR
ncbi:FxsA family membrane protein [Streptomyces sp. NPDC048182]|uniref:FxsA family membrane protein n=1 Tax=Streptomyces sp. NPDC048182 TaxID=3365507 RepID=UPI003717D080